MNNIRHGSIGNGCQPTYVYLNIDRRLVYLYIICLTASISIRLVVAILLCYRIILKHGCDHYLLAKWDIPFKNVLNAFCVHSTFFETTTIIIKITITSYPISMHKRTSKLTRNSNNYVHINHRFTNKMANACKI